MSAINTLKQSTTKKPLPEILKIDKNNFKIYKNFIKVLTALINCDII